MKSTKITNPKMPTFMVWTNISSVLDRLPQKWVKSNKKTLKLPGICSNELVPPVQRPLNGKTSKACWCLDSVSSTHYCTGRSVFGRKLTSSNWLIPNMAFWQVRSTIVSQIQIRSETVWFRRPAEFIYEAGFVLSGSHFLLFEGWTASKTLVTHKAINK